MNFGRLGKRLTLLAAVDRQRRDLERSATVQQYDRDRQSAISMLAVRISLSISCIITIGGRSLRIIATTTINSVRATVTLT